MAGSPLKVKLDVTSKRGAWAAVARFSGPSDFDVGAQGATVSEALRALAEAVDLYFEHNAEGEQANG